MNQRDLGIALITVDDYSESLDHELRYPTEKQANQVHFLPEVMVDKAMRKVNKLPA